MDNCGKCIYKEMYKGRLCCNKDKYCKRFFRDSEEDYYKEEPSKIEKINPNRFLIEEYEPDFGVIFGYKTSVFHNGIKNKIKEFAIGYCDGKDMVWKREFDYAFLFEKDGRRFWFHIPKSSKLLDGII